MSELDELISALEDTAREHQVPPTIFRLVGEISRAARELASVPVVQPVPVSGLMGQVTLTYNSACLLCHGGLVFDYISEKAGLYPRLCACVKSNETGS